MSNTPHGLAQEFPADADTIQALKGTDSHFAKIAEEYQQVNDDIHRAETNVEPMSEEHETALRKKRLALKDEIAAKLRDAV